MTRFRTHVHRAVPPGPPVRVLFVDDDELVSRSMTKGLARLGFEVTAVHSAEEALALGNAARFEVIVTDHNMPTMTGRDLIRNLLKQDASLRGRIILTSGDLHTEPNEQIIAETGCRGLAKPYQIAELALAIRSLTAAVRTLSTT